MSTKKIKRKVKSKKNTKEQDILNEVFKGVDDTYYDPKEIDALFQESNVVMSPALKEEVDTKDNKLKEMIVEYVGDSLKPENGEVTVEMVVQVMASDFPEFLLAVAEENWIRGYQQAMVDIEVGERLVEQELQDKTDEQP